MVINQEHNKQMKRAVNQSLDRKIKKEKQVDIDIEYKKMMKRRNLVWTF